MPKVEQFARVRYYVASGNNGHDFPYQPFNSEISLHGCHKQYIVARKKEKATSFLYPLYSKNKKQF